MNNENIKEQVAEGNGAQFKHTPEPWTYDHKSRAIGNDELYETVTFLRVCSEANAERIVECVNAMKGIDNPQKLRETWDAIQYLELDAYHNMKAQGDEMLECLEYFMKAYRNDIRFNAPGHIRVKLENIKNLHK